MSLSIYTYSNPYQIHSEPYWKSIQYAAHFCVSQTMVNGLESVYEELKKGQLSTVEHLTDALYPGWNDTKTYIEQYAAITEVLDRAQLNREEEDVSCIKRALNFNKARMLDSIRLMVELDIILRNIKIDRLTEEQGYLVATYNKLMKSEYKERFIMKQSFSEREIDAAIKKALHEENDKKKISIDRVDCNTVVFHGIHQFTPSILKAVEQVSKYRRVVMLFNYQEQYQEIYQTWLDVYSCFDITVKSQFNNEFHPNTLLQKSYRGNLLADTLAKLANGEFVRKTEELEQVKVIEFDNITEFSAYVAKIYEDAEKKYDADTEQAGKSVLAYMSEQFYSAENSVNDILKVYFPNQFGERHFLAYPIGHFFVAVTNMWDAEKGGINIENLNDVAECLYSEALAEKTPGALITTFNATKNYFVREETKTLEGIVDLLTKLRRQKKKIDSGDVDKKEQLRRLGYFDVTPEDITELIHALQALDEITKLFFEDFESNETNFRRFYEKVRDFVERKILPGADAEEEFKDIIVRLLARLEEIQTEKIEITSSFDCLKDTMTYYLKQEHKKGLSANWIVRDFQQIDGDVLQSAAQEGDVTYHFACVSDTDMNVRQEEQFPWPLDTAFFEEAYEPLDWKYQVYVKSRREFKHFKRYALIYGLAFNRCDFKLSYIKNTDDKENELYYLLKLLGIETKTNLHYLHPEKEDSASGSHPLIMNIANTPYTDMDCYRRKICAYRFALESIIENGTHFKDGFLLKKYLEVVLVNNTRKALAQKWGTDDVITTELENEFERLSRYFRFVNDSERMDIISNARNYIKNYIGDNGRAKRFPVVNKTDEDIMKKREVFLALHLENDEGENVLEGKFEVSRIEKDRLLSDHALRNESYDKSANVWCQWCAVREICLEEYKALASK